MARTKVALTQVKTDKGRRYRAWSKAGTMLAECNVSDSGHGAHLAMEYFQAASLDVAIGYAWQDKVRAMVKGME